jgi:hypothetical protein
MSLISKSARALANHNLPFGLACLDVGIQEATPLFSLLQPFLYYTS